MYFSRQDNHRRPVCFSYSLAAGALTLIFSVQGHALSLTDLLDRASNNEPAYLGAKANFQTMQARERQALGALLPQVSASASTSKNYRVYDTLQAMSADERDEFNAHSSQISLTQPVWRYANLVSHAQAEFSTQQAEYQLATADQDLFAKLITAWFDIMSARDEVLFASMQAAALRKQWQIINRGAELGSNGMPQVDEALAKYEQAQADQIAAETEHQLKLAALEQLVGPLDDFSPPFIQDKQTAIDESIDALEVWLQALENQNPGILAAQQAFEAADEEVSKQNAGHQPTVDLVASYNFNNQKVGGFPGQNGYDTRQRAVALQINVPIYSGGTQSAKVREAIAVREKARLDIEVARRAATLAAKQAWFGWHAASAKTRAAQQGIKASDSAFRVAKVGSRTGLKTELDALQAEQQGEAARRDFNKARYIQITSFLRLKTLLGQATPSDTMSLDRMFEYRDNSRLAH